MRTFVFVCMLTFFLVLIWAFVDQIFNLVRKGRDFFAENRSR